MTSSNQTNMIGHNTLATVEQFWKALEIWNGNPHLVNRRLCGAIHLYIGKLSSSQIDNKILVSKLRDVNLMSDTSVNDDQIMQTLQGAGIKTEKIVDTSEIGVYIYIKKLLPRNSDKFQPSHELAILDKHKNEATFIALQQACEEPNLSPHFPYSFCYEEEKRNITLKIGNDIKSASVTWLKEQLFPKIIKWADTAETGEKENTGLVSASLNLVPIDKYCQMYQHLKKKYGAEMVKIWPENTDPLKFVYEDVAIATYLLLLWEQNRLQKGISNTYQTFVDLGCGNGLLVHILNSEGHQGIGLDVRKRRIWDLYPSTTKLQVQPIVPSAESLFPEVDWIIGNHSDELTPWIPIIAARSSYKCKFFLLPCCCYELSGEKYQRTDSSRSQYMDYMDYIYNLCNTCGFKTEIDRLRIPSTKRICFVGGERNYPVEEATKIDIIIKEFINSKTDQKTEEMDERHLSGVENNIKSDWLQHYKIRENEEKVRNCTRLDRGLIEELVILIAKHLLSKWQPKSIDSLDGTERMWNAGGIMSLEELASIIPKQKRMELKNECGGLQTLLKNNSQVFFVNQGHVQLKMPSVQAVPQKKKIVSKNKSRMERYGNVTRKQKPCWFHVNHPDGCPLKDEDCSYKHQGP
ncbi:probable tRNA (uracil-O(2)-)-methyltransferase [Periplaneta americana]|uniref:probable tRNA (uracil-O(2)-)-methyltransferase n=1 Tax=Periplaneta americana TaxID=6978 RepID=UPI0037E8E312